MLENFNSETELKFKELSPEEKEKRGILGRLYGPMASIVKPTRNGRRYTESLWEKVFNNNIVKEMLANGGIPGELDHPVDREETDSQKIAIMMPEAPTKDKNGKLMGYFDILDTPCGRIAYSLAKYGFNLGVSSRGSGDTYEDYSTGEETVDEDSYSFNAFDLVLLPACEDARLQLTESFNIKKNKFNTDMALLLESSDEIDKKVISDTLNNLNFNYNNPKNLGEEEPDVTNTEEVADDNGTELVRSLQKALIENNRLQKQLLRLQEKLSVSYTKEVKLRDDNTRLKSSVGRLTESVSKSQALNNQIDNLKVQLNKKSHSFEQQKKVMESYKIKLKDSGETNTSLKETLNLKNKQLATLKKDIVQLKESTNTLKQNYDGSIKKLSDEILELKQDSKIKNKQYATKLQNSNKLIESYKNIADNALNKYVECKATQLGVSTNEIKNKLKENYSFNDIDTVCESLRSYKRNMSKLPFNIGMIDGVTIKEDNTSKKFTNPDDVLDNSLFNLLQT